MRIFIESLKFKVGAGFIPARPGNLVSVINASLMELGSLSSDYRTRDWCGNT
jgi:hypothetical protein